MIGFGHSQWHGGDAAELRRELFREGPADHGAVSGGTRDRCPRTIATFRSWFSTPTMRRPGLRCVACKICEKECPPQCIYIVKSEDKKPDYMGKPQFYPAIFDIDISVCMSCQICVEVCPFEAIKMDKVFELSRRERFDALLMRKDELAKSNTYYHNIHPLEAAEVDAKLAEAAEAKKKKT